MHATGFAGASSSRQQPKAPHPFPFLIAKAMMPNPAGPSWQQVRVATKELLASNPERSWGEFKSAVGARLDVPVEALRRWKDDMKELIAETVKEGANESQDAADECGGDGVSDGAESEGGADNASDSDDDADGKDGDSADESDRESDAMRAFKRMTQAMCLG